MRQKRMLLLLVCVCTCLIGASVSYPVSEPTEIYQGKKAYPVYPKTCDALPKIPSPYTTADKVQVVTARKKDGTYLIVPVTIENQSATLGYGAEKIGKGNQLVVDAEDFPTLVKTGLHLEEELDRTKTITGKSIEEITKIGRPKMSSATGFMANDEDIISVLKGDNILVKRLGLTHPQMAKPLFHVWNLILKEFAAGRVGRNWDNIQHVLYKGNPIRFGKVHPTRGFQKSIFNDEINGSFDINIYRELTEKEKDFLQQKYSHLDAEQRNELIKKLSHILTGEMEPYYVMRYGFYEGHTSYRVDPIALAFIFGLRRLEEIEAAFPGTLYEMLTMHFTEQSLPPDLRLSMNKVLKLADQCAAEKRAQYETFNLKFYPNRKAAYNPKMKKWVVHYTRKPNRWPGDHFSVCIDDMTEEPRYIGGL